MGDFENINSLNSFTLTGIDWAEGADSGVLQQTVTCHFVYGEVFVTIDTDFEVLEKGNLAKKFSADRPALDPLDLDVELPSAF